MIAHLKKELRDYKDAVEVLKKLLHTGKIADQNIYEAVTDAKSRKPGSFSVTIVLGILGISGFGYYYYMNHEMTKTEERRMKITDSVVKIFNESGQLYGSPKIAALINRSGENKMSQKYVLGIMKKLGIKPKYIRHRTITTVSRNFSNELKNILNRHFNPEKPDAFWCTDITYIWTYDDGFVYLTSVMDLYSRKIAGW